MEKVGQQTNSDLPLAQLQLFTPPTVADRVFAELHASILSLALPPGTKISETEVAKKMGVSRQPVREAFKRLAKLGFLLIRPQSSTTVSLISEEAVLRARFIRVALELQTCRAACENIDSAGIALLRNLIDEQRDAIAKKDREKFHELDDQFHLEICLCSDLGYIWDLIRESKGHMDRIRMLTLTTTSQQIALEEHVRLLAAISARDLVATDVCLREHLSQIVLLIAQTKKDHHSWFAETTD
ncbi:MAG: GntR family transcriptional regulator [Marinosulfonomonas sp.]